MEGTTTTSMGVKLNPVRSQRYTKSESDLSQLVLSTKSEEEKCEKLGTEIENSSSAPPTPPLVKPPGKFTNHQRLVLASLLLLDLTSYASSSIISPFFPQLAKRKNISTAKSGLVFSAYSFTVLFASLLMGPVVRKFGPKSVLLGGAFLAGVSNIAFGLLALINTSSTFFILCFIVRIFEGLGGAAYSTASYICVSKLFPENINTVMGLMETGSGIGLSLGPAFGGVLYDFGGYGLPFYVLGGILLITIPLNYCLLTSNSYWSMEEKHVRIWNLLKTKPILIMILVTVTVATGWGSLNSTFSLRLIELGLSGKEVGVFYLVTSAVYAFSGPLWGFIADRLTQTWIMIFIGLFFASVGMLVIGPSPFLHLNASLLLDYVGMTVMSLAFSLAIIPTYGAMLKFAIAAGWKDDVKLSTFLASISWSAYSFGGIIGPALGGFLTSEYNFPVSCTVMSAPSFTLALVVFVYFLCIHKPHSTHIGNEVSNLSVTEASPLIGSTLNQKRIEIVDTNRSQGEAPNNLKSTRIHIHREQEGAAGQDKLMAKYSGIVKSVGKTSYEALEV